MLYKGPTDKSGRHTIIYMGWLEKLLQGAFRKLVAVASPDFVGFAMTLQEMALGQGPLRGVTRKRDDEAIGSTFLQRNSEVPLVDAGSVCFAALAMTVQGLVFG